MAWSAANSRTAIIELLEGDIGTTRTVTAAVMKYGVFAGQPLRAQFAKAIQTSTGRHWFDVQFGSLRDHSSTSIAANGNRRIGEVSVRIELVTKVSTSAQETQRRTDLATVESDIDDAIQALHFPGNLTQTSAAATTGIVSGMLLGPDGGSPSWEKDEEDWERMLIRSHIDAKALVSITQAVS